MALSKRTGLCVRPTADWHGTYNEYVEIETFLHVVRCPVLSAYDYLSHPALAIRCCRIPGMGRVVNRHKAPKPFFPMGWLSKDAVTPSETNRGSGSPQKRLVPLKHGLCRGMLQAMSLKPLANNNPLRAGWAPRKALWSK
ncbi:MAG: hypothetical protein CM1200mP18_11720 [Gammaproteobacteria bacterium]|nr:MAG: hypothetical protein CM1200mP18_11720 [Gammaproteobacteria bacterium]